MVGPKFTLPERLAIPIAVTHVTVVPMDDNRLLPDQTVIIEDGLIKTLGPSGSIDTAGMSTVDGSTKYLLPGLADMHVHYWTPGEFALFLANGVTLVRNMAGAPFHLALQQRCSRESYPDPTLSPQAQSSTEQNRGFLPGVQ